MAVRPILTKPSQILLLGQERSATLILPSRCEQGIPLPSPASPLHVQVSSKPLPRQAHQPGAVSHMFRSTCTQARCCTLGKVWGRATSAPAHQLNSADSLGLHASLRLKLEQQLRGNRLCINKKGKGGFGSAEPKSVTASVSWGDRRGLCCRTRGSAALEEASQLCQMPCSPDMRARSWLLSPEVTLPSSSEHL